MNHVGISLPRKSLVRLTDHLDTDRLDMTIVLDWDIEQHSNKSTNMVSLHYVYT